jgi:hypothetical protein
MAPVASVHIADVGVRKGLRFVRKAPTPGSIDGLRRADVALTGPLSASVMPSPSPGRVGLIAFWDDDDALSSFLADHPLAAALAGGWHARLEPLRAFGAWPGLPSDLPVNRTTEYQGPALVLTLGRLRLSQTVRFLRTSSRAEGAVVDAAGLVWATGLAKPPFVSTCSLWESVDALSAYAYREKNAAHPTAISVDRAKPFHHRQAFVRFRPYAMHGQLHGRNPLPAQALA